MKRRTKKHSTKATKVLRRFAQPNLIVIGLAIAMVWLIFYQNGKLNLGLDAMQPPDLLTIAIVGLGIVNLVHSHPVVKFALLGVIIYSVYPALNLNF